MFSAFASAQTYGLEYSSILELGTRGLKSMVFTIINVILSFLGVLAIAIILYGGFVWMTSGGAPEKIDKAKKILISGAIGLLIILASFAIAQFILNSLTKATGGSSSAGADSSGAGALGSGIIESVYPAPGSLDIARNTSIIVTFKEAMQPDTLIDDTNGSGFFGDWIDTNGDGKFDAGEYDTIALDGIGDPNIKIVKQGELISGPFITEVFAAKAADNRTFRFKPANPLGSPVENIWYTVELTNNINKADGSSAFGALGSYDWSFEIGTFLDVTPPYIKSVQPAANGTYDRNIVVQMHFSEAIDPLSILSANILVDDGASVAGFLSVSNQYRTAEFLGTPCGINSCGETIYCLPALANITTTIKAATCLICPEAIYPFDGIVDMASNSFDGDKDGVSEESPTDDYVWQFNTTNNINLTSPTIISVNPPVNEIGVALKDPIQILFSDTMMYSSLNTSNIKILGGTIGYWITAEDIMGQTMANINHSKFQTATAYQSQATAGVKNNYQNCLYPSEGPGCAGVPTLGPCCCDGTWCACP